MLVKYTWLIAFSTYCVMFFQLGTPLRTIQHNYHSLGIKREEVYIPQTSSAEEWFADKPFPHTCMMSDFHDCDDPG